MTTRVVALVAIASIVLFAVGTNALPTTSDSHFDFHGDGGARAVEEPPEEEDDVRHPRRRDQEADRPKLDRLRATLEGLKNASKSADYVAALRRHSDLFGSAVPAVAAEGSSSSALSSVSSASASAASHALRGAARHRTAVPVAPVADDVLPAAHAHSESSGGSAATAALVVATAATLSDPLGEFNIDYGRDCCFDYPTLEPVTHPRHRNGLCYVSDKFRFVYLLVPKAGSSTSRKLAADYGGKMTTYSQLNPQQKAHYFTFAFVRDPAARLESAFTTVLGRAHQAQQGCGR
jgi:hypothetical protein